jgi:hypothetical protein
MLWSVFGAMLLWLAIATRRPPNDNRDFSGNRHQVPGTRPFREVNRTLTAEELGSLAEILANECDPSKAQALKEQIMAGFCGEERNP